MKLSRTMRWLGLVCAGWVALAAAIPSPARLSLKSASVLVLDQWTGQALVEKQAEAVVPIASLTKLMTAMVLLDAHLDPNELLTITIPELVFSKKAPAISGPKGIYYELDFVAFYSVPRRIRNGSLFTISIARVENL